MEDTYEVIKSEQPTEALSTSEVLRIFRESDNLDEIKSAVKKAADRLYATFATADARDKDGELIPIQDLISQQEILMERGGVVIDTHSNKPVGKTIAYKVMPEPLKGRMGILHLNQIYSHHKLDDKVWEETQNGKRTGSSVGGQNIGAEYAMVDGLPTKVLQNFQWFETSNVPSPANGLALNQAVSMVAKGEQPGPEFFVKLGNDVFKMEKLNPLPQTTVAPNVTKNSERDMGIAVESKEHPEMTEQTITQLVDDHLRENPNYYSQEDAKKNFINKESQEQTHQIDSVMINDDKSDCLFVSNIEKGDTAMDNKLEDVKKSLAALSPEEKAALLAEVAKASAPEDKDEDKEKKKAEASLDALADGSQPEAKKPSEAGQIDALKSDVANIVKGMGAMAEAMKSLADVHKSAAAPRPSAEQEAENVKKYNETAMSLALGQKKASWAEVQKMFVPQ